MADMKTDTDAWVSATCKVVASDHLFGQIDLSVPNDLNIPDVHLDALYDIIFANLGLPTNISN